MAPLQRIEIHDQVDVERARRNALESAKAAGLSDHAAAEWALVASELATNLLRHAMPGGTLSFASVDQPRHALVIRSEDAGPGIASIPDALREGNENGTSLGSGLNSIQRHSDDLQIETSTSGTSIVVCKWLP